MVLQSCHFTQTTTRSRKYFSPLSFELLFHKAKDSFPLFLQSRVTFQQISEEEAKPVANVVPPLMVLIRIWTTNGCHFAFPGFLRVKAGRISLTLIGFTVMLCDKVLLWSQTAGKAICSQSGEFWEMGKWETATCQDPETGSRSYNESKPDSGNYLPHLNTPSFE